MTEIILIIIAIIALTVGDVVGEVYGPHDDCYRLVKELHEALVAPEAQP